jgi:hypothetical protein
MILTTSVSSLRPNTTASLKKYSYTPSLLIPPIHFHTLLLQTPSPSPLHQHIPNRTPILRPHKALNLALRQPLERLVTKHALADIRLASHDACLHKEDFLAEFLLLVGVGGGRGAFFGLVVRELADLRLGVVEVVVCDRVVADDPGVHVEAGGLHDDALGGLGGVSMGLYSSWGA